MKTCPFFGICGGCRYDFTAPDYRDKKMDLIRDWELSFEPFWTDAGARRRADFAFAGGRFGFFVGGRKDIVQITHCQNLVPEINMVLPKIAALPFDGAGAALVTACENGIDLAVTSNVPYFSREFKSAATGAGCIRVTWNGTVVCQTDTPRVRFGDAVVDYPAGAFLQPTMDSERAMRAFVVKNAAGAKHIADLFCGIGNFTYALGVAGQGRDGASKTSVDGRGRDGASKTSVDGQGRDGASKTSVDGFDIIGIGVKRDLFKNPLTAKMLNSYDLVVMDPPRAGADAQCHELARSNVRRVIYVSCNPNTLRRDTETLMRAGFTVRDIAAFDQFVGSPHWELAVVFEK